jgi:hypothetical protein
MQGAVVVKELELELSQKQASERVKTNQQQSQNTDLSAVGGGFLCSVSYSS